MTIQPRENQKRTLKVVKLDARPRERLLHARRDRSRRRRTDGDAVGGYGRRRSLRPAGYGRRRSVATAHVAVEGERGARHDDEAGETVYEILSAV